MPTQIVMNHNGDTRYHFDARNAEALAKAEERFKQLTGEGFTAAVRTKPGEVIKILKPRKQYSFRGLSAASRVRRCWGFVEFRSPAGRASRHCADFTPATIMKIPLRFVVCGF